MESKNGKSIRVRVGNKTEFELGSVVRDLKGADPNELAEVLQQDAVEMRLNTIREFRLSPFPDAVDLAEWDQDVLLKTWPPLYARANWWAGALRTNPCLDDLAVARESLRATCRGCLSQFTTARQVLDWTLAEYGREQEVSLGKHMDSTDFTWIGSLCGFAPKDLGHLDRALAYAEGQLARSFLTASAPSATPSQIESQSLHAGTLLLMVQEVLETIKTALFGLTTAASIALADVAWYPPPQFTGRGAMEAGRKSVVFVGDNFLPMSLLVRRLEAAGTCDRFEVCGIGQAADDLPRFYSRSRWVGPMARARKVLRTGIFDVVVGSDNCLDLDVAAEASRTRSAFLWTGAVGVAGLRDRSADDPQAIAGDILKGHGRAWVRDPARAAEVVLALLEGPVARSDAFIMDEETAKVAAGKCRDECDLCSYACPNAAQVSRAIRAVRDGAGLEALDEVEKKCCLDGDCEAACPEKVRIAELMVAAFSRTRERDKFLFRPGRGGGQRAEMGANDFTASPGNSPGWFGIIGCGNANPDDVQWMANELACRNGIVALAGCVVGDIAHYQDPEDKKWFMQKYPFWLQPRSAANLGGCSACQFIPLITLKNSRSGAGVTHYANYVETVATYFDRYCCNVIVWGPLPERMYAIVSGLVRSGVAVVVGPMSAVDWQRMLPGNKWDWQRYSVYETLGQRRRFVEPSPKHLLIPVETREEAVVMAAASNVKPAQGFRMTFLDGYLDTHQQAFGELPDDWQRFVRSPGDLPIPQRVRLLGELVSKHGWKVEGPVVKEIPLPDGRIVDQKQYVKEYGAGGAPVTRLPRLCIRALRDRKA